MILIGVTATDSHQQECERIKIELECNADSASGSIGTNFASSYEDPKDLQFTMQEFSGTFVKEASDNFRIYRLELAGKNFYCDTFNSKVLFLALLAKKAFLSDTIEGRQVALWHEH